MLTFAPDSMWEKIANILLRNRLWLIIFLIGATAFMAYESKNIKMAYDKESKILSKP